MSGTVRKPTTSDEFPLWEERQEARDEFGRGPHPFSRRLRRLLFRRGEGHSRARPAVVFEVISTRTARFQMRRE